ncbi:glycosyltransferase family 4 protein [Allopusillimonas ginsengisoli]|nr:glycosyltransferase family 4 protein [Allopusillimonas ginsengisoli]
MIKNIWYVHPSAGGPGIGRYARPYSLAKEWANSGVRTTVFTAANHHQLDHPQAAGHLDVGGVGYEFISCRVYKGNGGGRLLSMADTTLNLWRHGHEYAAKYGRPDVIISSSPHPYLFLATHALARQLKAKSIFEVRDLWPLSFIELLGLSKCHPLVLFTGWVERYAYKRAEAVISLLPLTRPYMVAHGLAHDKWHYVPNGVEEPSSAASVYCSPSDENVGCIAKAKALKALGYMVAVYAGGLGLPNNVESLVRALALCTNTKIAAIIVGRGERKSAIERLVQENGLDDRVFVFDQVGKQIALDLLESADVGYISLKAEPLFRFGISPNKLFDYMLAGLPVLSCIKAGNDPVQEAGCGLSVPSTTVEDVAQALQSLASMSEAERKVMGARGRDYVLRNHSYNALAKHYIDILGLVHSS